MKNGKGKPSTGTPFLNVLNYNNSKKKPYYAIITVGGVRVMCKPFKTAEEAAKERDNWYRHSRYAKIVKYNFPEIGECGRDGKTRSA